MQGKVEIEGWQWSSKQIDYRQGKISLNVCGTSSLFAQHVDKKTTIFKE